MSDRIAHALLVLSMAVVWDTVTEDPETPLAALEPNVVALPGLPASKPDRAKTPHAQG